MTKQLPTKAPNCQPEWLSTTLLVQSFVRDFEWSTYTRNTPQLRSMKIINLLHQTLTHSPRMHKSINKGNRQDENIVRLHPGFELLHPPHFLLNHILGKASATFCHLFYEEYIFDSTYVYAAIQSSLHACLIVHACMHACKHRTIEAWIEEYCLAL
jgi:hypothetical protein